MDCKEYDNKFITDSEIIARMPCELSQLIVLSSNATSDLNIYDGIDTAGELKLRLRQGASQSKPFRFQPHVYFKKGMYIVFTQKVDGCFVQWRMRPHPNV